MLTPTTRQQVREDFAAKGAATIPVTAENIDAARAAARAVGRELGRPVHTSVSSQGPLVVHAWLADWPATVAEGQAHERNMRAAVGSAAR